MRNWYQSAISPFQREGSPEGPGAARGQGGLATVGWQGVKGCVVDVGGVASVIGNILEYHGLIDLDVMKESAEKRGEAVSKYQRIIALVGDIWVAQ